MEDENTGTDWSAQKQGGSIWPAPQPSGTTPTPPSSMGGGMKPSGTRKSTGRKKTTAKKTGARKSTGRKKTTAGRKRTRKGTGRKSTARKGTRKSTRRKSTARKATRKSTRKRRR